ncbi:MAG TPA: V4R domain-containing protein [Longimicrobiales bacterium]|nr:V4R domain-containing protein [Longimicrobiales bacterium]
MARFTPHPPECAIPVAGLAALRRALTAELGGDAAARALQAAGHAIGDAFYELLAGRRVSAGADDVAPIGELPESAFWRRVSELFAERGWGHLTHSAIHPGIGALDSSDWAEADPAAGATRPSCFITTGILANLLGRAAGASIGVLELECRSRGDLRCRFAFGGHEALEALYAGVRAGRDADAVLAELV